MLKVKARTQHAFTLKQKNFLQQSQRSNRNDQVPGSLNCIYFLAIARIVAIR